MFQSLQTPKILKSMKIFMKEIISYLFLTGLIYITFTMKIKPELMSIITAAGV